MAQPSPICQRTIIIHRPSTANIIVTCRLIIGILQHITILMINTISIIGIKREIHQDIRLIVLVIAVLHQCGRYTGKVVKVMFGLIFGDIIGSTFGIPCMFMLKHTMHILQRNITTIQS